MKRVTVSVLSLVLLGMPGLAACGPKKPPVIQEVAETPPPVDPNAWRAAVPAPGPERAWTAPAATKFELSNGIPVYLVKQGELPLVSVRLNMAIGREGNPKGKAGLLALTASMLDEGTKTRDSSTIASDAAALGAELGISAGDENTVVALDALGGTELEPSLDLMADVVLHPKFDKKDFSRVQGDTVAAIQAASSEPNDIARRVFLQQLWGKDHPYGVPAAGTEASVKALKLADVTKAYGDWWHSGNAAFVVAGNIDEARLKPLLEARFGAWKKGKAAHTAVAAPSVPLKPRIVFHEKPGAVQSVLRVGSLAVSRSSPDYWSDQVAVNLFGGMFSSRLNMALREEKGWSYGAYAGMSDSRDFGIVQARGSVQADKSAESVQVVMEELGKQLAAPPSAEMIKLTRDSLTKSLAGSFETNAATAGAFLAVPQYGLPVDAWQSYAKNVNGIDAAATLEASKRLLAPERMLVVVVGPRTIEVDDGKGGKTTVDVAGNLAKLGYEFIDQK